VPLQGRPRKLTKNDQLTLEWAGVFNHYHAPMMRTILTGKVSKRHQELYDASRAALAGRRKGDDSRQHLWRRLRRACPVAGGARPDAAPAQRLRLFGRRALYAILDGHADVLPGNPEPIAPNMTLFAHMIIMDSETETAMTLGRTYLTTEAAPETAVAP
jgi:Xaa-Pro dipeptidase